jgi:hypothetical protein
MANQEKFRELLRQFITNAKQENLEKDRRNVMSTVGQDIARMLLPSLNKISETSRTNKEDLRDVMSELMGEVTDIQRSANIDTAPIIEAIERAFGNVHLPEPKITVNAPDVIMPDEMNIKGWVQLQGVDLNNPLPVQLRDHRGNPINLFENITTILGHTPGGGGGGGSARIVKVSGLINSAYADYLNADNRLRVSTETGTTGLTDTELRAAHLDVQQVSGSVDSVNVLQIAGDTPAKGTELNVGYLRTFLAQDAAYSVRAIANSGVDIGDVDVLSIAAGDNNIGDMDVRQVSGVIDSVNVLQLAGDALAKGTELNVGYLRTFLAQDAAYSVRAIANSGVDIGDVDVLSIAAGTNNIGDMDIASIVSPVGQGDAASALRVVVAGNSDASVSATQIGTWTVALSGALTSAVVVGPNVSDAVDDNTAPVQVGGIARITNPTAVGAGDVVKATFDDVGRLITYPYQVRDLIATAFASPSTGIETTLLAGAAGVFFDCIMVTFANQSSAAVDMDVRDATGGGVVASVTIPADSTTGWAPAVPYPQNAAADTWTVDNTGTDVSGTTVNVTGLFVRNV